MSDREALGAFLDKWRARWPEWRVAEVFVPAPRRAATLAWLALRQELADAAWEGADPRPGAAKLAWWSDELRGWAHGRRRHPLGLALQRVPAPWEALAGALPALAAARDALPAAGGDVAALHAALAPFVAAAGAVSAAIAAGEDALPAGSGDGLAALAASLSAMRALAGAGDSAAAGTLSRTWPPRPAGTRADRVFTALARERLRALDASAGNRALPAWHTLWIAWRAGRSFPPA
ncbi:MAG TPA: phytoene/squalene synthase family protein [Luteimonas sp.]|nr:phytoene/squalene synthase family protein [Luteimonas sp.]